MDHMKIRSFRFLRVAFLTLLLADVIPTKGCSYSGPKHAAAPQDTPHRLA